MGTIKRMAKKDITTSFSWIVPPEHPEAKPGRKIVKKNPPCEEYLQYNEDYPDGHFCHEEHYQGYAAVVQRVKVGIHYAVGPKGEIIQGANEDKTVSHAKGWNGKSIGIEIVGKPGKDRGKGANTTYSGMYSETVITSVAKLVADICRRRGLSVDRNTIKGHDEVDPARRSDPGTGTRGREVNFDWNDFIKRVKTH
jgi:N-acetyl-anhydromuramyl-L-alanine amidase AmpD